MAICAIVARALSVNNRIDGEGMSVSRKIGWVAALLVFVADQLAKWAITGPRQLPEIDTIAVLTIFRLQ